MSKTSFERYWTAMVTSPGRIVLAAFTGGDLVGWLTGIALDNGNVYLSRYASLRSSFHLRVNHALVYVFIESARVSGLDNINFGLALPNRPSLDEFKTHLGFRQHELPTFTAIAPIVKAVLIRFYPTQLQRITGWSSCNQ
jgi:hypothetical protein